LSYTNIEMENMLDSLEPLMEQRNMVGYAAARNARILSTELTEYHKIRDEIIIRLGERDTDANGNPNGQVSIKFDSPEFSQFAEELEQYAVIEHDPDLFTIKYSEAIGNLTGTELLAADWMFED
jgi:hypothetical protein